jgi:hypothetical protein
MWNYTITYGMAGTKLILGRYAQYWGPFFLEAGFMNHISMFWELAAIGWGETL